MRRMLILIAAVAALLATALVTSVALGGLNTGYGNWEWVNPSVQGNTINGVSFVGTNGWAVGNGGLIMETTDGGENWVSESPSSYCSNPAAKGSGCNLNGVSFADANNGWAVGDYGTVWRTTNGGTSWTLQTFPSASRSLAAVSFFNTSVGVIVSDGYAYYTSNGGANWFQASGVSTSHYLESVQMKSATVGYAVGSGGSIYKTTNGGSVWVQQTSNTTDTLNSVYFIDSNNGFAVGYNNDASAGRLLRTTDGGATWQPNSGSSVSAPLYGVTVTGATNDVLVAVGGSGSIFRTPTSIWTNTIDQVTTSLDGGAVASGVSTGRLLTVQFADATTGYAGGDSGVITKTTTAGTSWSLKAGGETHTITGSSMIDENEGWVVGHDGQVMYTNDGGTTWADDSSGIPADANLNGVHFVSDTTGFAVGCQGGTSCGNGSTAVAYKYTGGGSGSGTWLAMTGVGAVTSLQSVHMTDSTHGWAAGMDGAIFRTTNGTDWTTTGTGTISGNIDLNSVDSTDAASNAWVVGQDTKGTGPTTDDKGVILKYSTSGGGTWTTTEPAGTPIFLTSIDMIDATVGVAVGGSGKVYKTIDGGTNWTAKTSGTSKLLGSVTFMDRFTGVAVGDEGRIIMTNNGGESWSIEQGGTSVGLYGASLIKKGATLSGQTQTDPNFAFVAGGNSAILKKSFAAPQPFLSWYDYGGATTGLYLWELGDSGYTARRAWVSGGWDWNNTKTTLADRTDDGVIEPNVFKNNGSTISLYSFDPASDSAYSPSLKWTSQPNHWDFNRIKVVTAADQIGSNITQFMLLYDYGNSNTGVFEFDPGTGTEHRTWISGPGGWDWNRSKILIAANFDADATTEMAVFYDYGANQVGVWMFDPDLQGGPEYPKLMWFSPDWDFTHSKISASDQNDDGRAEILVLYDYGQQRTALWVIDSTTWDTTNAQKWYSGPGGWDWNRSKLVSSADQNNDGKTEVSVLYDYGGNTTGLWFMDPASTPTAYTPQLKWYSGPGGWDWGRTKPI